MPSQLATEMMEHQQQQQQQQQQDNKNAKAPTTLRKRSLPSVLTFGIVFILILSSYSCLRFTTTTTSKLLQYATSWSIHPEKYETFADSYQRSSESRGSPSNSNDRHNNGTKTTSNGIPVPALFSSNTPVHGTENTITTPITTLWKQDTIHATRTLPEQQPDSGNHMATSFPSNSNISTYTQDDIIRFVRTNKRGWHVLLLDPSSSSNNSSSSSSSSNHIHRHTRYPFLLYSLSTNPNGPAIGCVHCHEHLVELLIDGYLTSLAATKQRRRRRRRRPESSDANPAWTLQILMDGVRDYVHIPCHGNDTSIRRNTCLGYPPVVTSASVSKRVHVETPFLHQFPIRYYNDCLYRWRRGLLRRLEEQVEVEHEQPLQETLEVTTGSSSSTSFVVDQDSHNKNHNHNNTDSNDDDTDNVPSQCRLQQSVRAFPNTEDVWERLVPQVYWRGTAMTILSERDDFSHFQKCEDLARRHAITFPGMATTTTTAAINTSKSRRSSSNHFCTDSITITAAANISGTNTTEWMILRLTKTASVLFQEYSSLPPRCLAVAMSLQAQAEWLQRQRQQAQDHSNTASTFQQTLLPWINIRFTRNKRNHQVFENQGYDCLLGAYTSPTGMSQYKYQIDLGGNGGTTWLGTITKLAMPGLLFHHETPMKDWFYDGLLPWVHYVPIHTNLSNLHDMFVWAEAHPNDAKRIAARGQALARQLVSERYMAALFQKLHVERLGLIADAYRPLEGESTLDSILKRYHASGVYARLVASCNEMHCDFHNQTRRNAETKKLAMA